MSKAKSSDPLSAAPRADNRPLWEWRDEVDWFKDEILDGKVASGDERVLVNGAVASYRVDADGDGFLFVEGPHTYSNGLVEMTVLHSERVTPRREGDANE